jgi:ankyrin repeat protein
MTSFVATVDIHSLAEAQSYEELDAELQSNPSRINEHESGPNNKTVLHIAAEHLNLPMVEMLVKKYHANINERGYNGQFTALCFAVTLNDDDDDSDMGDD